MQYEASIIMRWSFICGFNALFGDCINAIYILVNELDPQKYQMLFPKKKAGNAGLDYISTWRRLVKLLCYLAFTKFFLLAIIPNHSPYATVLRFTKLMTSAMQITTEVS